MSYVPRPTFQGAQSKSKGGSLFSKLNKPLGQTEAAATTPRLSVGRTLFYGALVVAGLYVVTRWTSPSRVSRNRRRQLRRNDRGEIKRLVSIATSHGWQVSHTGKNHIKFVSPDPRVPIIIASGTPSDWRAVKDTKTRLRRAGLPV